MAKEKDGERIDLYWGGDYPGFEYVKGKVDIEQCHLALVDHYGEEHAEKITSIEHTYAFWGVGMDCDGERSTMFYQRDKPGKGRFPVTKVFVAESSW